MPPIKTELQPEEEFEGLRPRSLEEFVGQRVVREQLQIAIDAARGRGECPDHLLLSGLPGLGKTSLAQIVAKELGSTLHSTTGPALERARDLAGILSQLKDGDCLFIDEIHRIPAAVEEYLYPAMEDFSVDLVIDQGPNSRTVKLRLAKFTLIGATTREGLLSAPFRSRFGLLVRIEAYPLDELTEIVNRSARLLQMKLEPGATQEIARRARGTPRVANRYLRRVRDFAQVHQRMPIGIDTVRETFASLRVDSLGLEELDRQILEVLGRSGGAVGLKTIAAAIGEAEDTVENLYEPFLLRQGLLERTPRGRVLTREGFAAIGRTPET